jgi:dTDP-4-amino-4,6-dideoxygalactose transaminase
LQQSYGKDSDVKFGPGTDHDFSNPGPLPLAARIRVNELLESGRLFRYQGDAPDVTNLEKKFSAYIGAPFTMACNSGGCGIFLALKALGVKNGDKVLVNAWTLSPVPGAVVHAGGTPVFVDCEQRSLAISIDDLSIKAHESGAKVLLLSYMRGHVPNIDAVLAVTKKMNIEIVEDCAHTLGGTWKLDDEEQPRHLGTFGAAGIWSLQTNKSINCGEGGLISTSRQDIASYITIATGSYGHFSQNGASGEVKQLAKVYPNVPNMSMRMTTLHAAMALPQLEMLDQKLKVWANHAWIIRKALFGCPHCRVIKQTAARIGKEAVVWSSIQFELLSFSDRMVHSVIDRMVANGVPLAWYGGPSKGFTSTLKDWKFADPKGEQWDESHKQIVKTLLDLPLYHTARWSSQAIQKLASLLTEVICDAALDRDQVV